MAHIVSANYHKEFSDIFHWLFRVNGEKPEHSIGVKSIYATGVEFIQSSEVEAGFGCKVVAYCQFATHEDRPPSSLYTQAIFFDDINSVFRRKFDHQVVPSCRELILEPNGDIWAVLHDDEPVVDRYIGGAEEVPDTGP